MLIKEINRKELIQKKAVNKLASTKKNLNKESHTNPYPQIGLPPSGSKTLIACTAVSLQGAQAPKMPHASPSSIRYLARSRTGAGTSVSRRPDTQRERRIVAPGSCESVMLLLLKVYNFRYGIVAFEEKRSEEKGREGERVTLWL